MAIPEYNEIKVPALELFADGKPRKTSETYDALAKPFALSADERAEVLPSGSQRRWENRVLWALYDLYRPAVSESVTSGERANTLRGVGGGNGVGSP